MFYLKDPTTKEPSPTLTMMVVGVGAIVAKYFFSGVVVAGITIASVNGYEAAALITPFLALYGHKRVVAKVASKKSEKGRQ